MSDEVEMVKVTVIFESDSRVVTYNIPKAKDIRNEAVGNVDRFPLTYGAPLTPPDSFKLKFEMEALRDLDSGSVYTIKVEEKETKE